MVRKTARLEAICVFYLKGKVYEFDGNEPTTGNWRRYARIQLVVNGWTDDRSKCDDIASFYFIACPIQPQSIFWHVWASFIYKYE